MKIWPNQTRLLLQIISINAQIKKVLILMQKIEKEYLIFKGVVTHTLELWDIRDHQRYVAYAANCFVNRLILPTNKRN